MLAFPRSSVVCRTKNYSTTHKATTPAVVKEQRQDGELGGGAEAAAALPDQEGRAPAAHGGRGRRRHRAHLLGAQRQSPQGQVHRVRDHARSGGGDKQGAGRQEAEQDESQGFAAIRRARARLRRRRHCYVAVPGWCAGEALRRVHPGPALLRRLHVAVDGPVTGVPGGVPGGRARHVGRGEVHGGGVQLRRDGGLQDGRGAPGPRPVARRVGLRRRHDRLHQRDHAREDRRQVVGGAAAAGLRQGPQGAALHRHPQETLVPGAPSQGLPPGDVHQPQGKSRAAGRFGGQQQRRHRARFVTENTSALGTERQHFQHRAGQDNERAARRGNDAAEHRQGRASRAPGEALRLQPAPPGVPGIRQC